MTTGPVVPDRPQLRPVEVSRISHEGSDFFLFKDPQRLSDQSLLVPIPLGPYIQHMDGTHTVDEIIESATNAGAAPVPREILDELLGRMNEVWLLANGAYANEMQKRLDEYRTRPSRNPALADLAYPGNADDLRGYLDGLAFPYMTGPGNTTTDELTGELRAIVTPHIDYERGGDSYAMIWEQVRNELREVELFVVFGTDHNGDGPRLTLTNQNYDTPIGSLETDRNLVSDLARILEKDSSIKNHPFVDEFNHANEHSIELATVWLNRTLGSSSSKMLPVLCGSLGRHTLEGSPTPDSHPQISQAIELLQQTASERRTVFIAAADLAHVGPAFGDPEPLPVSHDDRSRVQRDDEELLAAITGGDRNRFFDLIRANYDRNRVCGVAPIYMTLWAANITDGNWCGYLQAQADENDTSFVSIAGAALYG